MQSKFYFFSLKLLILLCLIVLYGTVGQNIKQPEKHEPGFHKILYVDRNFTNREINDITAAAINWTLTTNHIVEFDVVKLPAEHIDTINGIAVMKITEDNSMAMVIDQYNDHNTLGFYNKDGPMTYIALITDRIADYDFFTVMSHELGHALGLRHISGEDGIGTLMYPSITLSSTNITDKDLEKFCELYNCNKNQLKTN